MRTGGRTRKERQKRKGQEVGVLKGWEEQEIVGVMQQCNVENGQKGQEWEVGSLDHHFYQLLLTVHEYVSTMVWNKKCNESQLRL